MSGRTPRERWGTCCPYDPECEHSFLDHGELERWLDTPLSDAEAAEIGSNEFSNSGAAVPDLLAALEASIEQAIANRRRVPPPHKALGGPR